MKLPLTVSASVFAAAALLLAGCAESPFSIKQRIDPNSVRIEIDSRENLRFDGKSYGTEENNRLEGLLREYGNKFKGRPVTLILDEGSNPKAETYVRKKAAEAGLGTVTVVQRSELGKSYRVADTKEDAAATPAAAETKTAAAAPVAAPAAAAEPPKPEAAPTPPPAAPAVAEKPADAPKPEVAPAAPVATTAPATPAVCNIFVTAAGTFTVDGQTVAEGELSAVLARFTAANPGSSAVLTGEANASNAKVYTAYKAAKNAKFAEIKRAAK
ncbi:MAG: hypothetical protein LBT53_09610 [Puniceicoccales bacterium]|jgi:biopolymer transport protein ExbD|nr:hypothetical protein [Puniceicoccales bacterium]